jgi:hypothetical protein
MGEGGLGGPDDLERELERLPEVRAARVVTGPAGRILEIHLVSDGSKPPKQLTRDVETVAATQGLDIDRRTISIAQMPEDGDPIVGAPQEPRLTLSSMTFSTEGTQATCRVRVMRGDAADIGEASGPATSGGRLRLIAQATIDAAASLSGSRLAATCDNPMVVDAGEHSVAVAVLVFVSEDGTDEEVAPGIHPLRGDADDACVRAVLDALNRHYGP